MFMRKDQLQAELPAPKTADPNAPRQVLIGRTGDCQLMPR